MTPELLLQKFGYLAVFVGTFLEGETILVMAGFFAERGYLDIYVVAIVAAGGGACVSPATRGRAAIANAASRSGFMTRSMLRSQPKFPESPRILQFGG